MTKNPTTHTEITDLTHLSHLRFRAQWAQRPAESLLPAGALSADEPMEKDMPLTMSATPIVLATQEAGEMHLNNAITHRPWTHYQPGSRTKPRAEPFAARFHPKQPVWVLVIDEDDLESAAHTVVLKDYYQIIQPVAQAVPTHSWQEVVAMFGDFPAKAQTFARVVFNLPAETLSAHHIRALLNDVVSADSVQRYANDRASARRATFAPPPAATETASDLQQPECPEEPASTPEAPRPEPLPDYSKTDHSNRDMFDE